MSKFDNSKVMPLYSVIAIIMSLVAVAVIGKTIYTMTAGKNLLAGSYCFSKERQRHSKAYQRYILSSE